MCNESNRRSWQVLALALACAVTFTAAQSAAPSPSGAVMSIAGNRQLATGKMGDNARINHNRDYVFRKVPKLLHGLQYVSHAHKQSAKLTCTVKTGGRAYLCLESSASPTCLGVDLKWTSCGTMRGTDGGGDNGWTIYRADVKAGQKLTIPAPNKWGAVLAVAKIDGLTSKVSAGSGRPSRSSRGSSLPVDEFGLLAGQIAGRNPNDKAQQRVAKETLRKDALILESDRDPADVVLRRTAALLANIRTLPKAPDLSALTAEMTALQATGKTTAPDNAAARRELFDKAVKLRRRIAFSNPLLDFDKIAFIKHHRSRVSHMCDQYFGFHANRGGGVYVLENAFSGSPTVRDVLAEATVTNGRLKGKTLAGGSFISLDVSYDAKEMLFAWTAAAPTGYKWSADSTFHIFKIGLSAGGLSGDAVQVSGADRTPGPITSTGGNDDSRTPVRRRPINRRPIILTQLTDGKVGDFDPFFMPNGRIGFISERRGGFGRCHGRPVPTYTVHTMRPDGSDIIPISYHETNEWHPSVDNAGMIVYTRWDYVDRDSDVAHHIWLSYPDGRDPRSYHGNYPRKREMRPWMEMAIRAIPGSHRYIAVSTPHHGQNYGSLVMIDQRQEDDFAMSQVKRVTPEVLLTESEDRPGNAMGRGRNNRRGEVFGQPWPLSEDYYLTVYDPGQKNYGVYLIDSFGNRELLYRDPSIACLDPMPLHPRPKPPAIAPMTTQAVEDRPAGAAPATTATIAVMNVYDSDFTWPQGSKVVSLRVVQLFPKATPNANKPNVGLAAQALCRGVLGTVPVEVDGSAHFQAPVGVPMYFQALDARGRAIQSMKSNTYLHSGENLVCQGCHEPKKRMVKAAGTLPLAVRRAASKIKPDVDGSYPLTFPRLVQGVLDNRCMPCHAKNKKAPDLSGAKGRRNGWSRSFETLVRYGWGKSGGNGAINGNGGCISIPGKIGANGSKLMAMFDKGSHKDRIKKIPPEELYRITLWLDCNTNFFGAYHQTDAQLAGKLIMPTVK